MGDRRVMTKEAEVLQKLDGTIATMYAKRTGRKPETFARMMDEETWMNAAEALDHKLIDKIIPAKKESKNLDPLEYGLNFKPFVAIEEQADEPPVVNEKPSRAAEVAVRLRMMELEGSI